MKNLIFAFLLIPFTTYAQQVMEVDVSDYCKDQLEQVEGFDCNKVPKFEIEKKDESGKTWKLRFTFGYFTTDYYKTDLNIKTERFGDVVVKDIQFEQRTGADHYNPKEWENFEDALKVIHEPTNTFGFILEKGKNNFYLTVAHPKWLKSIAYKETVVDGEAQYEFMNLKDNQNSSWAIQHKSENLPEGFKRIFFQDTHMNLVWQAGYGRQIPVWTSEKFGSITYIPKVEAGLNTGMARSIDNGKVYPDTNKIQGFSAAIGNRVEYQKGAFGIFAEYKVMYSKIETGFLDGTINYNLVSTPFTFGVNIDIFNSAKSKKNKR